MEATVDSDTEGKFVIPLSYPPVSRIRVTKQDYAERSMTFDTAPAPSEVEIQLQVAAAGIFGKVWDSENHPAKWFTVSFFKSDETSPVGFHRNCRDGSFSIRDIQPGTYLVRISVEPEGVMDMPKGEAFVLPRLEIRRGYMYGAIDIHLQPNVKK